MYVFRFVALAVFFILLSKPATAIISPLGFELEELNGAGEKKTSAYLQDTEEWVTATGAEGLQQWINTRLALNTRSFYPLDLLGRNAVAIWWFIQRAFPHIAQPQSSVLPLSTESDALSEVVSNLLYRRSPQEQYQLLDAAVRMTEDNALFAEIIIERLGTSSFFQSSHEYGSLLFAALDSRNYQLVISLIDAGIPATSVNASGLNVLQVIASTSSHWHEVPSVNLESGPLPSRSNPAPAFTELRRLLVIWMSYYPDEFTYALEHARSAGNERAIEWLNSVQHSLQTNFYMTNLVYLFSLFITSYQGQSAHRN
ncbi:hypothetical protein [Endozoicomonas lisbonensis]